MFAKENGRAIVAMFLSTAFFMFNDALLKYTAQTMPLGQIIFLRGLVTTFIMAMWCWSSGAFSQGRKLFHPVVFGRSILEIIGSFMYLTALTQMPIANATAMLQAMPLAVTAGAAMIYGEVVGWRRWSAIAVGFAGVMLIIRPGMDGFDAWALLAVAAVVFMALRDLVTKSMPRGMPSSGVCFVVCAAVTLMGAGMGTTEEWIAVEIDYVLPLVGCSTFLIGAYYFAIVSTRAGDMSVVAPMRYTGLLWATAIGVLVWGQVPDAITITGMLVVVGSGLYTVHRERVRHKQMAAGRVLTKDISAPKDGLALAE
ncbi:EamA-like transporter family protein [Pseudovibrio axinellae]|uniref:EamA-like transporter family protein n=1 Tax=Pseudovibrio axinellae TaxID=989403 RepID=A0A165TYW9_9HYPH|nr:DMT family transporter [Pseudovibrio axinellae]KZL08490.1 EamA-like transporter family protein [Pseudovibrio axinellae]SEP75946.1 Permease of the drug/metabolite transporter (DMT) superfamily [Pseudovibrio axinellae]